MKKILLTFICLCVCYVLCGPAAAQEVDNTVWGTNGPVYAVSRSGNTIYLGGRFSYVGPNTGSGVIVNGTDGTATGQSLKIAGTTWASVPDGKGGWYIGGKFKAVQGNTRTGLAHLLPNGSLDPAFNPVLQYPGSNEAANVLALALANNTLYVGGSFMEINGQTRSNIAALDATTGQLRDWQPGNNGAGTNATVRTIAVSGNSVYVGGDFVSVGRITRHGVAALDAQTGVVIPTWPAPEVQSTFNQVNAIAVANNTVYVGSNAISADGLQPSNLMALDAITGKPKVWNAQPFGHVRTLAVAGGVLYVGGAFGSIGGQLRTSIAALDTATGRVTNWNPQLGSQLHFGVSVHAVTVSGNRLYIGGDFESVGQQSQRNAAALDLATGQLVSGWDPRPDAGVHCLAVAGNAVLVGGFFASAGGQFRRNLAAIDALTGRPTAWNPEANMAVQALAVRDEKVYAGGYFNRVGGVPIRHLAVLDKTTGELTGWQPQTSGIVLALAVAGRNLFVGGYFSSVGDQARNNLAVLDAEAEEVLNWNLDISGGVQALAVSGSTVYAGGSFTSIGGQSRSNLAAIDTVFRRVTAWKPEADYLVQALAAAGNTVYAGGSFLNAGGQNRRGIVALDATTGRATDWNPGVSSRFNNDYVRALAVAGNTVYAGGSFRAIGGQNRNYLAALNASTGQATAWNPDLDEYVSALAVQDGVIYAGGNFLAVGNEPVANFAAIGETIPNANYVSGSVFEDRNGNCTRDSGEPAIAGAVVVAQPGAWFTSTDSLGNYTLALGAGSYTIAQIMPDDKQSFTRQVCPAGLAEHTVRFTGSSQTISAVDFANEVDRWPVLSVSVASNRRRRCLTNFTTVHYCNVGTAAAAGVKVHLKLPPHVVPVSANVPYTLDKDNNLVFDVGTLAAGACSSIQLTDSVVCNDPSIRGLTQCTRAWITPANSRTPGADWDGSDITLKARCGTNGRVRLGIYNTGTGNMADSTAFRVYLDAQLALTRNFKLAKGDSLILQVPANGRTVRLEADQRPGHPTKQSTNVTLEACGTNAQGKVSLGFVAQLPGDDEEPEVAEECLPIIDSFDPNDKAVSPAGITDQHYTPTRSRLDYVIRFQNTGTDVAYKVVVVDTLSAELDVSTLQVGSVSHPYKVQLSGRGRPVLTFTFHNIMLPDSNANEPESHGYIQFSIRPKAGLPPKTRIENLADIFFDYNEPVRTNTTFNTLYDLPPVPAPAAQLDGTVVCVPTNTTVTAGTSRTVCVQDTVVLAAIRPAQGGGRWQRIGQGRAVITEPENPNALVTGLAYGENVFEWQVSANTCGSDSLAGRLTITRLPRPATPAIIPVGADSLTCNVAAGSYQWYLEGNPLGLHTRTIRAEGPGKYTVRVTEAAHCHSKPSPAFAWEPTATEPALAAGVRLYPNPTTGGFVVVLPADLGHLVQLTLSDAMGRPLAVRTLRPGAGGETAVAFDLSTRQKGLYLLKLQTPKGVVVRKVCKQ
jgi:uncharacterized repeat protein (TIGR01451 family)